MSRRDVSVHTLLCVSRLHSWKRVWKPPGQVSCAPALAPRPSAFCLCLTQSLFLGKCWAARCACPIFGEYCQSLGLSRRNTGKALENVCAKSLTACRFSGTGCTKSSRLFLAVLTLVSFLRASWKKGLLLFRSRRWKMMRMRWWSKPTTAAALFLSTLPRFGAPAGFEEFDSCGCLPIYTPP